MAFAQVILTLHWRGAKSVPYAKRHGSKLNLSMPTIWFADGSFVFLVVWRSSATTIPRWEFINGPGGEGLWWFRAESKWFTLFVFRTQIMSNPTRDLLPDLEVLHHSREACPNLFRRHGPGAQWKSSRSLALHRWLSEDPHSAELHVALPTRRPQALFCLQCLGI
jgi:hypothetical protein